MFCPNCGAPLAEGTVFCSNCGTATGAQQAKVPNAAKKNKLILIGAIGVVAVIAIVVVIVLLVSGGKGFSSPEEAAKNLIIAEKTADPELLLDCYPDVMIDRMTQRFGVTSGSRSELLKKLKDNIDESDRHTCVIVSTEVVNDLAELMDAQEDYGYFFTSAGVKVDEYRLVAVNALVDTKSRSYTVICVKIDGRWYAIDS